MIRLSLGEPFIKRCESAMRKLESFNRSLIEDFKEIGNPEWDLAIRNSFLIKFQRVAYDFLLLESEFKTKYPNAIEPPFFAHFRIYYDTLMTRFPEDLSRKDANHYLEEHREKMLEF